MYNLHFLMEKPLVAVIMGSSSDWETMKHAVEMLDRFGVPNERHVISAHRTPIQAAEFASGAEARGVEVIIAGAGGAAHLAGVIAAYTLVPVLGVPMQSAALQGLDSLLSIVQMPGGIPVGTLAIGKAGATNAGLLAVSILSNSRPDLRARLRAFRDEQTEKVRRDKLP
jgi:5-(carboxyamino)imidazole ribonucleotide mutase